MACFDFQVCFQGMQVKLVNLLNGSQSSFGQNADYAATRDLSQEQSGLFSFSIVLHSDLADHSLDAFYYLNVLVITENIFNAQNNLNDATPTKSTSHRGGVVKIQITAYNKNKARGFLCYSLLEFAAAIIKNSTGDD